MALNIKTCTIHGAYSGGFETCPYCGKPFTVSTKTDSGTTRLNESKKPRRLTQGAMKPHKVSTQATRAKTPKKLTTAQINAIADCDLYAMLLDGGLHQITGFGKKYHAIVDRLIEAGYKVASFKWRVVDGKGT